MINIDMHHHFLPEEMIAYIDANPQKTKAQVVRADGGFMIRFQQGWQIPVHKGHYSLAAKKEDLTNMRLDAAALSVAPVCFFYWLDGETALETAQICNDWVANVTKNSKNLYPMATIPMQNIPLAGQELKRCHEELGINALEIAPIIEGVQLDDPRFDSIYEYCNEHKILLYLHPQVMEVKEEYARYYNANLIGNVLETCIGLNHLLFGGVFQRFPSLRVLASHGGGYFPYQFGRLMHGYTVRPEPKTHIQQPPDRFLKNIYFDTITHWLPALQFLVDTYGADHVVLGTDYPFDMGDLKPVDLVDKLRLTKSEQEAICFQNAWQLLSAQ